MRRNAFFFKALKDGPYEASGSYQRGPGEEGAMVGGGVFVGWLGLRKGVSTHNCGRYFSRGSGVGYLENALLLDLLGCDELGHLLVVLVVYE